MSGMISMPATMPFAVLVLAAKATLLLTLIFLIRLMMRTASASTRCFVIGAGIIMVGCLPMLAWVTPEWKLPIPISMQSRIVLDGGLRSPTTISSEVVRPGPLEAATGMAETQIPSSPARGNPFLLIWFIGTVAALGRVFLGMAVCARRRLQAVEHDATRIHELVKLVSGRIGLRRTVSVQVGGGTEAPHIYGILNPVLHLPQKVLHWPEKQLTSVLLHELAHIKRRDHILWPLANLVVSWLWFNPLVWLALAWMRKDKERACDDYVVACGCNRISYAQHLLEAYRSLKTSTMVASVNIQFARKNDVRERIMYMLNQKMDRRPISKGKQFAVVFILIVVLIPLTGISGFSTAFTEQGGVGPDEREAVVATLGSFYAALSDGSDFQTISEEFLTSDYFDDSSLTLESTEKAAWLPVFENTTCCITEGRPGVVQKVRSRITSLQRDGDEIVATLQLDITGFCLDKRSAGRDTDSNVVFVLDKASGKKTAIRECPVVNSLSQQIRFRHEDNAWRISRFKDGVAIMRMDTFSQYGTIFLVWINDIDHRTTPIGSRVFKVIPRDIVPDAHNAEFVLEE